MPDFWELSSPCRTYIPSYSRGLSQLRHFDSFCVPETSGGDGRLFSQLAAPSRVVKGVSMASSLPYSLYTSGCSHCFCKRTKLHEDSGWKREVTSRPKVEVNYLPATCRDFIQHPMWKKRASCIMESESRPRGGCGYSPTAPDPMQHADSSLWRSLGVIGPRYPKCLPFLDPGIRWCQHFTESALTNILVPRLKMPPTRSGSCQMRHCFQGASGVSSRSGLDSGAGPVRS